MRRSLLIGMCCAVFAPLMSRGAVVSYDAAGETLPAGPAFARFDADNFASSFPLSPYFGTGYNAPQSVTGGVYATGPTQTDKYTFWYENALGLDHTRTIEVSARLRLVSESSQDAANRAGLALALTDDRNLYTELYIHPDEVFITGPGRVRLSSYSLDATQFHTYTIREEGDVVSVDVDGIPRITGGAPFVASGAPTLASWAVVGDITSSAGSSYEMTRFSVSVVPEPGVMGLMAGCGVMLGRRWRKPLRRKG